jgi:hypothetical protein
MKYILALLIVCLISPVRADTPLEPQSGFEWDLVEDARVIGYRVYINGQRHAVDILQGDTNVDCAELGLANGEHEIYVTAYSQHQESAPSNTLQFTFDGTAIQPPNLKLKLTIEIGQ